MIVGDMSTLSSIPGYVTANEAADLIGVSHAQVTRYVADGKLPHIRVGKKTIMIKTKDAKTFKRPKRGNPAFQKK